MYHPSLLCPHVCWLKTSAPLCDHNWKKERKSLCSVAATDTGNSQRTEPKQARYLISKCHSDRTFAWSWGCRGQFSLILQGFISLPKPPLKWLDGWEEGHLERQAVRSIPSKPLQYRGHQAPRGTAVDWWKTQNNLLLVAASVTLWLTQQLARTPAHTKARVETYWIFGSSVFWVLSILLSYLKFTYSVWSWAGIVYFCKLLWNGYHLFVYLPLREKYTLPLHPSVYLLWFTAKEVTCFPEWWFEMCRCMDCFYMEKAVHLYTKWLHDSLVTCRICYKKKNPEIGLLCTPLFLQCQRNSSTC